MEILPVQPIMYRSILKKRFNIAQASVIGLFFCLRHNKVADRYARQVSEVSLNHDALKDKSADRLLEAEILGCLHNAVEKMTPQCRNVFVLSRFEGKSYKEIAEELGIAEKTVENQMGKALKVARKELQEFLPITMLLYNILH